MTRIVTEGLCRTLGTTRAVVDVSLTIEDAELFFLLGPSGCGKSTLLGLIAGLDAPDSGRVSFDGRDVTHVPTEQRNAVMCFQSYALFPHLDVQSNVGFGLKVRRASARDREERVARALELVRMTQFAERKPAELSGGQQQRVALARALAVDPTCLLLDEPLSNLDARLRQEMRGEIRRVCKTSKHTTLYVTHDQKEALSVADRIAVMNQGRVVQLGTPLELFNRPNSAFVAEFISGANLIQGTLGPERGRHVEVETALGPLLATRSISSAHNPTSSRDVVLSVRPDLLQVLGQRQVPSESQEEGEPSTTNRLVATVVDSGFLGESSEHQLAVQGVPLRMTHAPPLFELPNEITIRIAPEDLIVHPKD